MVEKDAESVENLLTVDIAHFEMLDKEGTRVKIFHLVWRIYLDFVAESEGMQEFGMSWRVSKK